MKKKTDSKALTSSLKAGSIALIFLVLGYQAAIFIHKAAVTKIISNRDHPDTVYVFAAPEPTSGNTSGSSSSHTSNSSSAHTSNPSHDPAPTARPSSTVKPSATERHNAEHSKVAEKVREQHPAPPEEPFRFNPNTVSIEDLIRLGFTQKQAEAIDNYRQKGGHFNRKADFAKSYVVSEEAFARLEPYIDIPKLDLNRADSTALVALPGIGGWFASQIIKHRTEIGGYSSKEQLLNIYRMDQERYSKIADLVYVRESDAKPFPLWRLPADSLAAHPYIRNRNMARAIILYRDNNPRSEWTLKGLLSAGVITQEVYDKLSRTPLE